MSENVYFFFHSVDHFILSTFDCETVCYKYDRNQFETDKTLSALLKKTSRIEQPELGHLTERHINDNVSELIYYALVDSGKTDNRLLFLVSPRLSFFGFVAIPMTTNSTDSTHLASAVADFFITFALRALVYPEKRESGCVPSEVREFELLIANLDQVIGGKLSNENKISFAKNLLIEDDPFDERVWQFLENPQLVEYEQAIDKSSKDGIITLTKNQTPSKLAEKLQKAFRELKEEEKTSDFVNKWIAGLDVKLHRHKVTLFTVDNQLQIDQLDHNFLNVDPIKSDRVKLLKARYFSREMIDKINSTSTVRQAVSSFNIVDDMVHVIVERCRPCNELLKLFLILTNQNYASTSYQRVIQELLRNSSKTICNLENITNSDYPLFNSSIDNFYIVGSESDINALISLLNNDFKNIKFDEKYGQIQWPEELNTIEKIIQFLIDHNVVKNFEEVFQEVHPFLTEILDQRGKKAKTAIVALVKYLLDLMTKIKKDPSKNRRSKRGEHVINNNVLSVHRDIIEEFVYIQFNCSFEELIIKNNISHESEIYHDYHHPLRQDVSDNIRYKMIAHIPDSVIYFDVNSLIYGILLKIIRDSATKHLIALYNDKAEGSEHKSKITTSVELLNQFKIYVDQVALHFWLTQSGGDLRTFEECRKEVAKMFDNLYDKLKFWIKEIRELKNNEGCVIS